jgi:hypothetical protein
MTNQIPKLETKCRNDDIAAEHDINKQMKVRYGKRKVEEIFANEMWRGRERKRGE